MGALAGTIARPIGRARIETNMIVDLLASGWSEVQILDSYPHLQQQDLQAVFAFARDCPKCSETGQVLF